MQKALLLALIFGAFLFSPLSFAVPSDSDYLRCVDIGGTFLNHPELGEICSTGAPFGTIYDIKYGSTVLGSGSNPEQLCNNHAYDALTHMPLYKRVDTSNFSVSSSTVNASKTVCNIAYTYDSRSYCNDGTSNFCYTRTTGNTAPPITIKSEDYYCPPDDYPFLVNFNDEGTTKNCFAFAPPSVPDEEECDDILGNCTEPDPFECFLTTSGSEVCFADPNEKCDVESVNGEPVFSNCSAGCGFVNDNFVCADEPDLPSLDDCIVTTNGYACPSDTPEPDDNIDSPDKPLSDMQKGDFKDVLKGVETRLDGSNKLLNEQIKRDKDNTNKLAGLLETGNKSLKSIDDTAGGILSTLNDSLTGDADDEGDYMGEAWSQIKSALGLTGEETIDDLTVAEIDLDDYKSEFSFSVGTGQCPQPRQINILNKTFYMEWEPFCDAFDVLGYFILAAAYFFSIMIAFGGRS